MAARNLQLKPIGRSRTGPLAGAILLLAGCVPQDFGAPEPPPRVAVPPPPAQPLPAPATPAPPVAEPAPAPGSIAAVPPPARTAPPVSAASASLISESRAHQAAGRYELAAASIERALRIEPSQPVLWLELGTIRLREGDYAQAESVGRKALTLAGGDPAIEARAEELIRSAQRR